MCNIFNNFGAGASGEEFHAGWLGSHSTVKQDWRILWQGISARISFLLNQERSRKSPRKSLLGLVTKSWLPTLRGVPVSVLYRLSTVGV
jgi:hypothetical protein